MRPAGRLERLRDALVRIVQDREREAAARDEVALSAQRGERDRIALQRRGRVRRGRITDRHAAAQ
ncbi:MAG: hypothetical protein ACREME_02030 [Gemmatimonadales bacterium]